MATRVFNPDLADEWVAYHKYGRRRYGSGNVWWNENEQVRLMPEHDVVMVENMAAEIRRLRELADKRWDKIYALEEQLADSKQQKERQ